MKSSVVAIAAALATSVVAQPHGHHHQKHHLNPKRADSQLVVVTEYVSTTTTIGITTTIWVSEGEVPTSAAAAPIPTSTPASSVAPKASPEVAAQFFEPDPSSSSASLAPKPAPTYVPPPPPPPPPAASTSRPAVSVASVAPVPTPEPVAPTVAPVVAPPKTSATPQAPPPAAPPAAPVASPPSSKGSSSSSGALVGLRGGATVSGGVCTEASPCEGKGTYYDTIGTGSCGMDVDGTNVPIIALPKGFMEQKEGANPNNNPYCNKGVTISYNGKTVNAYVFDKCPGCSDKSIDLSHAAFKALASDYETLGHVQMNWWFN